MKHSTRQSLARLAGETQQATPAPMQKSVVTGVTSAIFLNQIDREAFGEGAQLEKANHNCYSVGDIREILVEKGKLVIRMSRLISGCGHPPSEWETESYGELVVDLEEHDFAYIGSGDNGGGSRLFLRSKHFLHGGFQTIRIFPRNGKFVDPLNVATMSAMWNGTKSFTVAPPKPNDESSLFWRRPKPWMREYLDAFSD